MTAVRGDLAACLVRFVVRRRSVWRRHLISPSLHTTEANHQVHGLDWDRKHAHTFSVDMDGILRWSNE